MRLHGIRGATVARANERGAILEATEELLAALVRENHLSSDDVVAAWFTVTPDLDQAYPAEAARRIGFGRVALLGGVEAGVPGSPRRCIRVLLLAYTPRAPGEIVHVYLREAARLRPEWGREEEPA